MVAKPGPPPVTIPVPVLTDAVAGVPELQAPIPASLRVIVDPEHTTCGPLIAGGSGPTVTMVTAAQPLTT